MKKIQFLILACLLFITAISQSPFTPGNIVVSRIGDGSIPLTDQAHPVFLDEYTPAGFLVQSISMPTTTSGANKKLVLSTVNRAFGALTLSPDKRYLGITGYDANIGELYDTLSYSATIKRTIGLIDYTGNVNTTTSLNDAGNLNPYSAVTSNGTDIWACFDISSIRYATVGATTSTSIDNGTTQARRVTIRNGQLFTSNSSGFIMKIGSGLPVSGPQTSSVLPGINDGGVSQFIFADFNPAISGDDVLYVVNSSSPALQKYSFDGTNWISNGVIGVSSDRYMGITGVVTGTSIKLYIVRGVSATSPSGSGELVTLTDNTGYNGAFSGTPTLLTTYAPNTTIRGVSMVPEAPPLHVSAKVYLQGAFSTALGRNKDVTANWAAALNAGALSQPYNSSSFGNYNGGESKTAGFFQSNASPVNTDITDWVLVELRNSVTPTTIVARRAAFVREDGKVVDLDGTSDVTFPGIPAGNYYIVIRHRNHLSVRSATAIALDENAATTYDFTTSQSQAYQDPAITTNAAMKDLTGTGVFGMWAGNANSNTAVRSFGGTATTNDFLHISNIGLGGNVAATQGPPAGSPVYSTSDVNMDGSVRAVGGTAALNDFLFLWNTCLGGNLSQTITAHQ